MKLLSFLLLLETAGAAWGSFKLRGQPCPRQSQPWQAAIFQRAKYTCGATLISSRWVLTAAHCLTSPIQVRLGVYNLYAREGTEQLQAVAKVIVHPEYNDSDHDNDLMLLKLQSPAALNRHVQPLGLASRCAEPWEPCAVSGWSTAISAHENVSIILYCSTVHIVSEEQCMASFPGHINRKMLCAALKGGGTDSCEGDSGGPLVCNGKLQGVVSWGDVPCATTLKPGVYMNVCKYHGWLQATMWGN